MTQAILVELVKGEKTLGELSDALGLKYGPLMEEMRRLERDGRVLHKFVQPDELGQPYMVYQLTPQYRLMPWLLAAPFLQGFQQKMG